MTVRVQILTIVGAGLTVLCCLGTAIIGGGYQSLTSAGASASCGGDTTIVVDPDDEMPTVDTLTQTQLRNAAAIIAAGQQKSVPARGWVIAVATALQESQLQVYANDNPDYPEVVRISMALPHEAVGHDHDSVGLFQQRPIEGDGGWGTVKDLMTPAISAGKFYTALIQVSGWRKMALTDAAQKVQRSAYPDAYAKHEPLATAVVNALAAGAGGLADDTEDPHCATEGEIAASGWTLPVHGGEVGSGFRTTDRPNHQGVDITVPHDTPIYAATSGTVVRVKCNISPASHGCDRDGSPSTPGCGWYVDLRHAGDVYTRYCHQIRKPLVNVGDQVTAGQQIGSSGSSGHSSGPHLHYEVHLGDETSNTATDPIAFMASVGVPMK